MWRILWFFLLTNSCYSLQQSYHFIKAYNSRVDIPVVLESDSLTNGQRAKLVLLDRVLRFAKSEKLNTEDSYKDFIDVEQDAVSYTVSASEANRFKYKRWWFPFVGSVPYLGYFDEAERDKKYLNLKAEGYDVAKGSVAAFSSLGWFQDPIYSSMLRRSDESFIALILHELIHRTMWIPGEVKVNENIAEFGSIRLTKKFLELNEMHSNLDRYIKKLDDRKKLKSWVGGLKTELKKLYKSDYGSLRVLYSRKAEIINKHQTLFRPDFSLKYFFKIIDSDWNNASILGFSLYAPDMKIFEDTYRECGKKYFGEFLKCFQSSYGSD